MHTPYLSIQRIQVLDCSAKRLQHMKRLLATANALSTLGALPVAALRCLVVIAMDKPI